MNLPTPAITNVPKREESRAKRHFYQVIISEVWRWKCKYCIKNYGLNTSTTSLWKHLERTHQDKLSPEDTKQKSGNDKQIFGRSHSETTSSPDSLPTHDTKNIISTLSIARYPVDEISPQLEFESSYDKKRKHELRDEGSNIGTLCTLPFAEDRLSPANHSSPESNGACRKKQLVKRLAVESRGENSSSVLNQQTNEYGFADLVSDIVTLRPADLEQFQDILLQHVFLQQQNGASWSNRGPDHQAIMDRQRDRVVETLLRECGWKFDMNVYPVLLFRRRHLVLDLVYRKANGEHRACFLDCLELPDEYPMELLSIMIFRKLCEFHVEDKMWQVFIGNEHLRGLTDILRNIFRDNNLSDSLECETVDFSKQIFTVKQDAHDVALSEFCANLKECRNHIEELRQMVEWVTNESYGPSCNAVMANPMVLQSADDRNLQGLGRTFHQCSSLSGDHLYETPDNAFFSEFPVSNRNSIETKTITTSVSDVGEDNVAGLAILKTAEQLRLLQQKCRPFQEEIRNIERWTADHLFVAYHMCSYCFYVCNEVNLCRNASGTARFYLADLLQQLCARRQLITDLTTSDYVAKGVASPAELHQTLARLRSRLHGLIFRDYRLGRLLDDWDHTAAWWLTAVARYRQLREAVCNRVTASDTETSMFARHFGQASRQVPPNMSEERWMKFVHWKIWRNFST